MFTKIGAILLGTGSSQRAAQAGPLHPVEGEPLIRIAVRHMLEGGIDDIVVVLGRGEDRFRIAAALTGLPVCMARNENGGPIRTGMAVMPGYVTGMIIAPSDYPPVLPGTYRNLDRQHARSPGKILLPVRDGRGGYPILLPEPLCRPAIAGMPFSRLMKAYSTRISRIATEDQGVWYSGYSEPNDRRRVPRRTEASRGVPVH